MKWVEEFQPGKISNQLKRALSSSRPVPTRPRNLSIPTGPGPHRIGLSPVNEAELEILHRIQAFGSPPGWEAERVSRGDSCCSAHQKSNSDYVHLSFRVQDPRIQMRNIHLKDAQWESTVLLSGSEEAPLIQDRSRDGEREISFVRHG